MDAYIHIKFWRATARPLVNTIQSRATLSKPSAMLPAPSRGKHLGRKSTRKERQKSKPLKPKATQRVFRTVSKASMTPSWALLLETRASRFLVSAPLAIDMIIL